MYNTERLKELRKKKNIKSSEMAEKINITPSFYSQIENQKRRLFYDTAVKISNVFNLKPDEIFYISEKEQ